MKEQINSATVRAAKFNRDGATKPFHQKLQEGQFQSTRCKSCQHIAFPPRLFCNQCGHEDVDWVDLPKRGTLYSFTYQQRSFRFNKPKVLGVVELEGVGFVLTKIDAPIDDLSIGQKVEVDFLKVDDRLTVHQFKPV